jgi:hypothetical protein
MVTFIFCGMLIYLPLIICFFCVTLLASLCYFILSGLNLFLAFRTNFSISVLFYNLLRRASYPMGTRDCFPGVKRPGREADHSPPYSAEVKNAWSYTSTPQYVFKAWCLVKHRDNFTFSLPLLFYVCAYSRILFCESFYKLFHLLFKLSLIFSKSL